MPRPSRRQRRRRSRRCLGRSRRLDWRIDWRTGSIRGPGGGGEDAVDPPRGPPGDRRRNALCATVSVDAGRPSHPISPMIYGASAVGGEAAAVAGLTTTRWGGNRSSRFNWQREGRQRGLRLVLPERQGRHAGRIRGRESRGGAGELPDRPDAPLGGQGARRLGILGGEVRPAAEGRTLCRRPGRRDQAGRDRPSGATTLATPRSPPTPAFQAEGIMRWPGPRQGCGGAPDGLRPRQRADALVAHPSRRPPRAALLRRGLRPRPRPRAGHQEGRPARPGGGPLHLGVDRLELLGGRRRGTTTTPRTPTARRTATSRSSPGTSGR